MAVTSAGQVSQNDVGNGRPSSSRAGCSTAIGRPLEHLATTLTKVRGALPSCSPTAAVSRWSTTPAVWQEEPTTTSNTNAMPRRRKTSPAPKILAFAGVVLLALLLAAPVRSHRAATERLAKARVELSAAAAERAEAQRQMDRAGTKAAMIEQAREYGYVFRGETPWLLVSK